MFTQEVILGSTLEEVGKVNRKGEEPIKDIFYEWVIATVRNWGSLVQGAPQKPLRMCQRLAFNHSVQPLWVEGCSRGH